MKQPTLYDYSLETQFALPYQMSFTFGYQGSSGFHFLRLVNQNFLYAQSNGTCATGGACTPGVNQTPFSAAYVPTADVHTSYNALNVHLEKRLQHGVNFSAIYTWSKSLDNASNEGPGFLTNQTDPANPRAEYGPVPITIFATDSFVRRHMDIAHSQTKCFASATCSATGRLTASTHGTPVIPWTPVIGVPSVALVNGASQDSTHAAANKATDQIPVHLLMTMH